MTLVATHNADMTDHQRSVITQVKSQRVQTVEPPKDVTKKVNIARLMLMKRKPFEASIVGPMKIGYAECGSAMTNTWKHMWFDPAFVTQLREASVMTVMAHEGYHCALFHGLRAGHGFNPAIANIAQDLQINAILRSRGFDFSEFTLVTVDDFAEMMRDPEGAKQKYAGKMTAWCDHRYTTEVNWETIYHELMQHVPPKQQGGGGQMVAEATGANDVQPDAEGDTPDNASDEEKDDAKGAAGRSEADVQQEMKLRIAQGAQAEAAAAKQRGEHVDAWVSRFVDQSLQPKLNWRVMLRRYIKAVTARDDYTMRRPNRRGLARGVVTPSLRSEAVDRIATCSDTSGSVDNTELSQHAAEVATIVSACRPRETHVAFCDTKVRNTQVFKRGQPIEFKPAGGGGTDFFPAFEWAATVQPQVFVLFTDAYGRFPDEKPPFPTIVVLVGSYVDKDRVPDWAYMVHIEDLS